MAEFTEVMKQKERMHEHYTNNFCNGCPIGSDNNGRNTVCASFIINHPQEAEELIMKWASENPIKTNADKFKEVFGIELSNCKCAGIKCPKGCNCSDCKFNHFWTDEYKEPDKE